MTFFKTMLRNIGLAALLAAGFMLVFTSEPAKAQFNLSEIGQGTQTDFPLTNLFDGEAPAESLKDLVRQQLAAQDLVRQLTTDLELAKTIIKVKREALVDLQANYDAWMAMATEFGMTPNDEVLRMIEQHHTLDAEVTELRGHIDNLEDDLVQAEADLTTIADKVGRAATAAAQPQLRELVQTRITAANVEVVIEDLRANVAELERQVAEANAIVGAVVADCRFLHTENAICRAPAVAAAIAADEEAEACNDACEQPVEEIFRDGEFSADGWGD